MELCCLIELWLAGCSEMEMSCRNIVSAVTRNSSLCKMDSYYFPRMARGEQCCVNIRSNVKAIRSESIMHVSETQGRVKKMDSLKFVRASYFDLCSRHTFMLLEWES